jgi:hypothetical protein
MKKLMAVSVGLIMTIVFILVAPVYAQVEFDDWVGQWYKGTVKDKGLFVDDTGTEKESEKLPSYAYVVEWDETTQTFSALLIQSEDDGDTWNDPVPYSITVIGGTPLDYVGYGLIPPGAAEGIELFAIILNIKGKEKNGELKGGKAKSVGGCVVYDFLDGTYFSAGESLSMKVVPEDKVPDEVKEAIIFE